MFDQLTNKVKKTDGFNMLKFVINLILFAITATQLGAHSGGVNSRGCHLGLEKYHCHATKKLETKGKIINGKITHVRDGDTIEVQGIAIRLSALDCPERGTVGGDDATKLALQFLGLPAKCELTGAKTYDRLVGYCSINGRDFGEYMMEKSSCKLWKKYDVWERY